MNISQKQKSMAGKEKTMKIIFLMSAIFSIFAVICIFVFLIYQGFPAINKIGLFRFIFGTSWNSNSSDTLIGETTGTYGILPMIVGSLLATVGSLVIGGVLGVLIAIYLACFAPKKIKNILTQLINLLAGIPSVIYGFFGMKILLPALGVFSANGEGSGILAVSIILGIMILPTIVSLSKTSIEAVDTSYYQGSVALGATKEQSYFKVVVPAAKSGIIASIILGVGRAIGETMAVVMVSGGNTVFPDGLFASFRTMTANIVMEMSYAGELQMGALIATGVVLLVFILLINILFNTFNNKKINPNRGRSKSKDLTEINDFIYPHKEAKISKRFYILMKYFTYLASVLGVVSLLVIVAFVMINGLPHITSDLLFGEFSFGGEPTIFPSIVATFMVIILTSVISFPIGIFTAIYLNEYTKKNSKIVKFIRMAVETLAGIPSIVYGLFGLLFFCNFLNFGTSIYAGSFTLALMIIPTTVRSTEESLKSVSMSLREGSYALGCGKIRTIFRVVIPSAMPGIMSAVILGIGRMISESAAILFTMGASLKAMPGGFSSSGTTLAVGLYALAREGMYTHEAYATACILIFIVFGLNLMATLLISKLHKKLLGK